MKIGIMGGTFNPIHHGHLILSEYIRIRANLDKVIFIPTGTPPHKDNQYVLDGETRLEMVKLSIKNNPYFLYSDMEVKRDQLTYTIDTVMELKDIYKEADLYMIVGADTLLAIHTWKDYKKIFSMMNFIVADRLGLDRYNVVDEIKRLNKEYAANIVSINSPVIDISSTLIRDRLKAGLSIKYLLPEVIEDFIIKNNLYR